MQMLDIEIIEKSYYEIACDQYMYSDDENSYYRLTVAMDRMKYKQTYKDALENMMLNKISEKYGKQEFYAKVEPDNYASQFLFEKLIGVPVGVVKDFQISDERVDRFIESFRYLLDEKMKNIANTFEVEAE